jgi:hypothetical protein
VKAHAIRPEAASPPGGFRRTRARRGRASRESNVAPGGALGVGCPRVHGIAVVARTGARMRWRHPAEHGDYRAAAVHLLVARPGNGTGVISA